MLNRHELITIPREQAGSYAELCPWFSLISNNVVITIDGMLLAGFKFEGMDVDGKTDETINRQINLIENCLNTLNSNSTVWSYLDRKYGYEIPKPEYNDWYAEKCGDQLIQGRKKNLSIFKHQLFIGYKLPNMTDSLMSKISQYSDQNPNIISAIWEAIKDVYTGQGTVAIIKNQLVEMLDAFELQLESLKVMASNIINLQRLEGDLLLGALHERMNPASLTGPLKVGKRNWFLPSRMTSDVMVRNGDCIKFVGATKNRLVNVLSIVDEPEEVSSMHIDALLDVDSEFTLCQIFEIVEQDKAKKAIQSHEQFYKNEAKDLVTKLGERFSGQEIDKIDTGKLILAEEAQHALADLTTYNLKHGFHSSRLLVYAENAEDLKNSTSRVCAKMRVNGYSITQETTGLFGAFLSTLPGNNKVNPRKYLSSVEKIADLLPMRGKYEGEKTNKILSKKLGREVPSHIIFETESGIPYQFNFHVGDVGHTLIIGGTGAGKTTLANLALSEFQKYGKTRSYIFDKDYSMCVPSLLLGGRHIDGGKTNALSTNPIKRFLKDGEIHQAINWLFILLESTGDRLSSEDRELVSKAVQYTQQSSIENWHLISVYTYVRGHDQKVASRFIPFIDISTDNTGNGKGVFSGYFDADEDAFELSDILCMECSKIIKMPEIASPFLFYVTYCIEKGLDGTTPTFIYIEECWHYFKNDAFAEILEDWARTLRKKLAFLVMVTQGAKEFKSIPSGNVIVGMSPTKIFLPIITDMTMEERGNYVELFGINDQEFEMIENAIPKRDYIIKQPGITKVVKSRMPELTLISNDACANEAVRNQAMSMARNNLNWRKKFVNEVLNVNV